MRLSDIKENASSGATGAGSISTSMSGGTPPTGQFFGGDPTSSIYSTIKRHRNARKKAVKEATKIAKPPEKPSGKSEIIGSTKPYREPKVLGPTAKVKSVGKILGGSPKKNPTLSTKFFGTCSAANDPGNKLIIAELTYKEFKNARNAVTKTCPACETSFKNIHDVNQKFCSQNCEKDGKVLLKLKETFHKPMQTKFQTKDGKIVDVKTVRDLVKRVMDDSHGHMGRLQACLFVSGMMKNCTGWTIHYAIDELAKKEAEEMYGKK